MVEKYVKTNNATQTKTNKNQNKHKHTHGNEEENRGAIRILLAFSRVDLHSSHIHAMFIEQDLMETMDVEKR